MPYYLYSKEHPCLLLSPPSLPPFVSLLFLPEASLEIAVKRLHKGHEVNTDREVGAIFPNKQWEAVPVDDTVQLRGRQMRDRIGSTKRKAQSAKGHPVPLSCWVAFANHH